MAAPQEEGDASEAAVDERGAAVGSARCSDRRRVGGPALREDEEEDDARREHHSAADQQDVGGDREPATRVMYASDCM